MSYVVFLVMLAAMLVCMVVGGILLVRPSLHLYRTTRSVERGLSPLAAGLAEEAAVAGIRADKVVTHLDALARALDDLVASAERLATLFGALQEGRAGWRRVGALLRQ